MRITWEVDGEYAGHGSYETEIDDDDLAEYVTEEEKREFINQEI